MQLLSKGIYMSSVDSLCVLTTQIQQVLRGSVGLKQLFVLNRSSEN